MSARTLPTREEVQHAVDNGPPGWSTGPGELMYEVDLLFDGWYLRVIYVNRAYRTVIGWRWT